MRMGKPKGVRIVALLMALMMTAGLMSGCGGNEDAVSSDPGSSPSGEQSGSTTTGDEGGNGDITQGGTTGTGDDGSGTESTDPAAPGDDPSTSETPIAPPSEDVVLDKGSYKVSSVGFPIVTEGSLTLDVMIPGDELRDYDSQAFTAEYEEMTGIDINYRVYNSFDSFVIKASVMQSGNQPDIYISPSLIFTTAELEDYEAQGIVLDLAPYLDTWGPNIAQMVNSYPVSKNFTYQPNGKVYALPGIYPAQKDYYAQEYQLMINEEWLYELGLEVPTTTEEFYQVLRAFKTQDPNGNGRLDEEGFGIPLWVAQMWNPWGLNMSWYIRGTIDEKGNVENGTMTTQFREGIRYWKKLYDEDLINTDAIGATGAALNSQLQKCGIVAYPWVTEFASESDWENWTPISWPKAPEAGNYAAGVGETNSGAKADGVVSHANLAFIFKSCDAPEAALRWLDYFYTDDGSMLWNYGPAGTTYTKIGGQYKLVSGADQLKLDNYSGVGFGLYTTNKLIARNASEMSSEEKFYTEVYKKANEVRVLPTYSFYTLDQMLTKSERATIDELTVGDLQWGIDAIQGKVNVETDWNAYINKYSEDYAKWKEIYQAAFDRVYG